MRIKSPYQLITRPYTIGSSSERCDRYPIVTTSRLETKSIDMISRIALKTMTSVVIVRFLDTAIALIRRIRRPEFQTIGNRGSISNSLGENHLAEADEVI